MTEQGNRAINVGGTGYSVSISDGQRRAISAPAEGDPGIPAGLQAAGFQVAASLSLAPDDNLRRGLIDRPQLDIAVPVAPGEASILLLEDAQGGLSWRFPDAMQTPTGRRSEGESGVDHYTIADTPSVPVPGRRSFVTDWAIETVTRPIRVHVVRFLARRAVSAAVAHIEASVVPGPVLIEPGYGISTWRAADISQIAARVAELRQRPAPQVLLLVHGTFSSTAGSFGALARDPVLGEYDLVLGYDHRTLAEDPVTNAEAFLATLYALDLPDDTIIDTIAYSRGGLVYRALVEQLAQATPLNVAFRKAVFVGCTNAGTLLAEPDNWKALLDIYTNALVSAARIGLGLAGAAAATPLMAAAIRTMGCFAQMLSQVAISERRVPGLAAMEPDGALIAQLNGTALPSTFATRYFTIGTDFNTALQTVSAPERAALSVLNRVTDRLYGGAPNDMVVPTRSMSDFGQARLAEQQVTIPEGEGIYHTTYFTSGVTRQAIADWLVGVPNALPEEGAAVADMHTGSRRGLASAKPETRPNPRMAEHEDGVRKRNASIDFGDVATTAPEEAGSPVPEANVPGSEVASPLDAPPPGEMTERFIAAEMNPYPPIERPANVYVTVSPDEIVVADHAAAAGLEAPVALQVQTPLTIEIISLRNCEVVDAASAAVDLTESREEVIKFRVRGLAPGEAEVLIVARQGSRSAATFTLKPVFVEAAPAPLRAAASVAAAAPISAGRTVLRIYEFKASDSAVRLQFNLTSDSPEIAELETLQINGGFSLEGYTGEVIRQVENAWNLRQTGSQQEIYDSFLRRMRSDAKVRTEALIPDMIRRRLWQNRDQITEIQVISGEPLIPWELMYLSDPDGRASPDDCFFAERALTRWLHDAPLNRRRMRPNEGKCRFVIPSYSDPKAVLQGAAEERAMLDRQFPGIAEINPTSSDVCRFLANDATDCALLHFACHGLTKQNTVIASDLLMESQANASGAVMSDPMTWQDVYAHADFGPGGGPLVFVNACQTGLGGSGIAGPAGFASAFLRPSSRRGAAAFIGALWSVDDKLAGQFAAKVYEGLTQNLSLGRAVAEAREVCKTNNDFTWLAYSVYANG